MAWSAACAAHYNIPLLTDVYRCLTNIFNVEGSRSSYRKESTNCSFKG